MGPPAAGAASSSSSMEADLSSQMDEIELLNSMYPEDITVHNDGAGQSLDIRIPGLKEVCCSVHFHLGPEYPSSAPPVYELSAPFLKREEKREIHAILGEIKKIIGMTKKNLNILYLNPFF